MRNPNYYLEHRSRWFRRRISTYWWLDRWPYLKFVLRELSSIFVAFFVVLTLLEVHALGQGPEAHQAFREGLRHPVMIGVNAVGFLFVLFHTITWFNLAPRATVIRIGGRRVPDFWIAAPNYAGWLVVSAAVAWLMLRG